MLIGLVGRTWPETDLAKALVVGAVLAIGAGGSWLFSPTKTVIARAVMPVLEWLHRHT